MAFLCHLSSFFPCTSHELCTFHRSSFVIGQEQRQRQLRWGTHCNPPRRVLITISASSSKKPRVGKKVKSNVDLCNELREFVSAAGLPEGHVPSLKELSHHGREDLAKIVRRRGYKLITDLLSNSTKEETNLEASSAENEDGTDSYKNESKGQDENVIGFSEEVSLPNDNSIIENEFSSANGIQILNSGVGSCMSAGSSTSLSLQEKAAKFIQNGELDIIEVDELDINEGRRFNNLENNIEAESREPSEESSKYITTRTRVTSLLNGSALASRHVVLPATENHYHRNDFSQAQGVQVAAFNEDMDAEDFEASEMENQVEINRLKVLLHQKELELSQLREQIEKEKHALSILQTEAESEINKAQKLISEKDAELQAAEESLSGLKEVQIEYLVSGENVEVAGSFNGWHHQIKMEPHPLTRNPTGSRNTRLWSTVLWLYPGLYEIKFIVDGHWRIDPKRESVTRGHIQNNILRVDR